MLEKAISHLGQSNLGFNDPGQCVAFENLLWLEVYGLRFPLQGARTAKELLTCKNTRPDLFEQRFTKNPSIGDTFVLGGTWGGYNGAVGDYNGHTGTVESINGDSFVGISQNYTPNKVTRNTYKLGDLLGYIHNIERTDMATDQQIDEWISTQHQIAFGTPPNDAVFNDWRKVLKNNFVDGSVSILKGIDTNAGALKNQPKGNYVPVNEQLYKKG